MKCRNCGAQASEGLLNCDFCGSRLSSSEEIETEQKSLQIRLQDRIDGDSKQLSAQIAGTEQTSLQTQLQNRTDGASEQLSSQFAGGVKPNTSLTNPAAGLPDYYVKAFEEFARSSGASLKPKFNLGAFVFGGFWYLYRGLWAKGLLYFVIAFGSGGTAAVIPWIYGFMFGTYDLYLLKKDHKQLW